MKILCVCEDIFDVSIDVLEQIKDIASEINAIVEEATLVPGPEWDRKNQTPAIIEKAQEFDWIILFPGAGMIGDIHSASQFFLKSMIKEGRDVIVDFEKERFCLRADKMSKEELSAKNVRFVESRQDWTKYLDPARYEREEEERKRQWEEYERQQV